MAHMDIHYGFSVNGVAAIHTEILKIPSCMHFYEIYPEKFNNKTNGYLPQMAAFLQPVRLAALITEKIGTGYQKDAMELEKLLAFKDDEEFLNDLVKIKKREERSTCCSYQRARRRGIKSRLHFRYSDQASAMSTKRQQMNALYIIHKYLEIKGGKKPARPLTFIFGAKAAPAYVIARDIIHLLLVLQQIINNDPDAKDYYEGCYGRKL